MPGPRFPRTDVIVVGGGPTGLLVADMLGQMGVAATIVEAGPRLGAAPLEPTEPGDPRWRFHTVGGSARWPRVHGVGGRAHVWGGNTHRFSRHTFEQTPWPYSPLTLRSYYRRAERWLNVRTNPMSRRYLGLAKRLNVRVEPTRCALDSQGVWTGADVAAGAQAIRGYVTELEIEAGRATGIAATTTTGARFTGRGKGIVLAASPVETTRLLLASGVRHPLVGKGLTDHLTTSYLLVEPSRASAKPRAPISGFIPRFVNTSKRSERSYPGGFCIELRGNLAGASLAPSLVELIGDRMDRVDRNTASFSTIAAMGEQFPHPDRFVDLAPRAVDSLGRALPRIHRAPLLPEEERMLADMRESCLAIADELAGPGAFVVRTSDPSISMPVFHPASTCAIGSDDEHPCDSWGRYRGLENLWIADGSALPSSGDCHPTLTILAHATRVCESVRAALR